MEAEHVIDGRLFQSTLSMRRATDAYIGGFMLAKISIHALHEESDRHRRQSSGRPDYDFNPRSP